MDAFQTKLIQTVPTRNMRRVFERIRIMKRTQMKFGIVRFFDMAKGYGLVASDCGEKEFFVQQCEVDRAMLGQLTANQKIGFDVARCALGPSAVNLWATFGNR